MSRTRARSGALTAALLAGLGLLVRTGPAVGAAASPAATARALCAGSARTAGSLADAALVETSGLAWSREHRGVLWAHNDSGDSARVFAVGRDGAARGIVTVGGAAAVDWEDIAIGRGPGRADHLFLADTGGGAGSGRSSVTVYRFPEPPPPRTGAERHVEATAIALRYPDGPHDSEALLVDDRTGDLVLVSKGADGPATVYRARGAAAAPGDTTVTLEVVGPVGRPTRPGTSRRLLELAGMGEAADRVTAADAAPAAGIAVVRTYGGVDVYPWPRPVTLAEALLGVPCAAPAPLDPAFPQGEAVALSPDGLRAVTVSEGVGAPLVELRARRR